jgi:hypothetical protein
VALTKVNMSQRRGIGHMLADEWALAALTMGDPGGLWTDARSLSS